jgi:isoamylase
MLMSAQLKERTSRRLSPGRFYPLGATLTPEGVNFALYSQHAQQVFLLLFDEADGDPIDVIELRHRTRLIWHVFVHGLRAGQLYGYKVKGEYNPAWGLRFNERKLLIDPYSKAVTGKFRNSDNLLLGYDATSEAKDLAQDVRENTNIVPKSIVIDDAFDWQGDVPPEIPPEELIMYEVHVKGFTAHPSAGVAKPGTYTGFIEKIPYLTDLGINAVELLPIQEYYVEDFLLTKGLTNYWGYNTIGFFAPESSYGTGTYPGCQVNEFKALVRELHKAGIEVILDVVYNHTGEGSELGPTICFKGVDNRTYYALTGTQQEPLRHYMNYTGCGNSMNLSNPATIRFVMDSLRYWAQVMHVDGFRFDLASVLGREDGFFQRSASFFDSISQDPLLSRVKLIAEPWDIGTYEVGNFPVDWSEWNGRFRDTMRKFGKGDSGQVKDLGWRLTGSADLYKDDGRSAYNSINFVTCHDGFTLNDLVSYNQKHNEANLENNNDGANDNNSWNCGVEGETDNGEVLNLRKRLAKNFFCYLLFSSGTPMILGGDEILRTQIGNNNAYCQDNELSWFDWNLVAKNADIHAFVKKVIALEKKFRALRRRKVALRQDLDAYNATDITWYGCDLEHPAWDNPELRTLCCRLDSNEGGAERRGSSLYLILNGDWRAQPAKLPPITDGKRWYRLIDTSLAPGDDFLEEGKGIVIDPPSHYIANARSFVMLLGK